MKILGQISKGLEELGAVELTRLGATSVVPVFRGVFFETDVAGAMRINYTSRLFDRFLLQLVSFPGHTSDQLYAKAVKFPWEDTFGVESTFAISSAVSGGGIRHSQWAALKLKDAIADHFRELCGKRPSVDRHDADVNLDLRIRDNKAEIRLDLSGGALHRRGYRKETVAAPIRETVAAAAVEMTEWTGDTPLLDPMCGSGTLLCEALMKYCRVPAGFLRQKWGFFRMEGFSQKTWQSVKAEADGAITALPPGLLSGSDISRAAVSAARVNLATLPGGGNVAITLGDWRNSPGITSSVILTNPPHGIRIFEDTAGSLLGEFGDFLKQKCAGTRAFIYIGDTALLKKVGLRSTWRKELMSGGLDGRLARYDLY